MELSSIYQRNLGYSYPKIKPNQIWTDPGKYKGIDDLYLHPQGDFLLEGFAPPHMEITDFTVIEKDGLYHLYGTVQAPLTSALWEGQHHYIIHATTADFINYELHRPVLFNHTDHFWEESHVWPPFVLKHHNSAEFGAVYAMIYVGMNRYHEQCLCLAVSDDLMEWRRHSGNPVIDGSAMTWMYRRNNGKVRHMRDPHVIRYQEQYLLYYTAMCEDGYSAVALAASENLKDWTDLGPCFKRDDTAAWLTESPLVFEHEGIYHLLPSMSPGITCFVSVDPTNFHGASMKPITCSGVSVSRITAIEIIRNNGIRAPWLVGFYMTGESEPGDTPGKRIYLGLMSVKENSLHITRVRSSDQLIGIL